MNDLKNCPFCGSSDVGGAGGQIHCYSCPAKLEVQNTNTHYAAELWNKRADYDEITRLQSEVERLRGRVAELEEGLAGIENCSFGHHGCQQSAEDVANWMNREATRLLDGNSNAWLLRKKAEAVDVVIKRIRAARHEVDRTSVEESDTACTLRIAESIAISEAQRLRQQAAESERQ